jgi:copper transport protein
MIAGRVAALAAAAALLIAPASAGAHAYVVRTDPAGGTVLKRAPSAVTVVWDEAITYGTGGARAALGVYAADGRRVDSGRVEHPVGDSLTVSLPPRLPRGTYTVGWKVTSADTHVVDGAFTFSVGARSGSGGVARRLLASRRIPSALADGFAVTRFLNLLLLLLCAGGAVTIVVVLRDAGPAVRRRLWGALVACAVALALVALLGVAFEAAEQNGTSLWRGFAAGAIASVRGMRFGEVWLARAWLALIIAVLALSLQRRAGSRGAREALLLVAVLAVALTPSASAHASVDGALTFIVDAAHVIAAAAWGGGLAFLAAGLVLTPRSDRWSLGARAVPLFSVLALGSVALLLAAGAANAYLEVRALRGLVDTTYGELVLVKIVLALPLLGLGAFNHRVSAPRLRAGIDSPAVRRRFARAIVAELLVFGAIVGVTAVLVDEAPAKDVLATPVGPFSTRTAIGPFSATLNVAPAVAGPNAIDIRITGADGRPATLAAVSVEASLPSRSLGPLEYQATALGRGRFRVSRAQLAIAGSWRIQLAARQGQFNEWLRTVAVEIGG